MSEKSLHVMAKIPFRSEVSWDGAKVHVQGSLSLINKIHSYRLAFGDDPSEWPILEQLTSGEEILIQEFILKCRGEFKLVYPYEELCHCRMVPTEKVFAAMKEGLTTVDSIAEKTLAGTSCGSCRPDTLSLLQQFSIKD